MKIIALGGSPKKKTRRMIEMKERVISGDGAAAASPTLLVCVTL
jgi:hypothetical protein